MPFMPLLALVLVLLLVGVVMAFYPPDPNVAKMIYFVMAIAVIVTVFVVIMGIFGYGPGLRMFR